MKLQRREIWKPFAALLGISGLNARASKIVRVSDTQNGPWIFGTKVLLDGEVPEDCIRAEQYNDGTGLVWCWKTTRRILHFDASGKPQKERFSGRVEIIFPSDPDWKPWGPWGWECKKEREIRI